MSSILCKKNITFILQLCYRIITLFAIHYVNLAATRTSVRVSRETFIGSYYVNLLCKLVKMENPNGCSPNKCSCRWRLKSAASDTVALWLVYIIGYKIM